VPSSRLPIERVLLTNDDGIDAPGLAVLEEIAAKVAEEIWIVAPEHDRSGTSHSISLHAPLRVSEEGARRYAVSGTPGDCVVMAVRHLMAQAPPSLILSGVNRGANLGVETVFSGTVGGAMTGMLLGIPSIALSQMFSNREDIPWETARVRAPEIIQRFVEQGWNRQSCLNINFPAVLPDKAGSLVAARQGAGFVKGIDVISRVDPRGFTYHWLQFQREQEEEAPEAESALIARNFVTVTPLQFERTNEVAFSELKESIEGIKNK
jgi:5'-nucleotidase